MDVTYEVLIVIISYFSPKSAQYFSVRIPKYYDFLVIHMNLWIQETDIARHVSALRKNQCEEVRLLAKQIVR
jgi:hypothetical protein